MLIKRSSQKEIMDDFSITDNRIDDALNELKVINKFLGGNKVSKAGVKKLIKNNYNNIKLLDLGGGGSDNLLYLRNDSFKIYSIDLNTRVCKYSSEKNIFLNMICANVSHIPIKNKQINISHASLFFHHFTEIEIKNILLALKQISATGIIINDLRRNLLALWGIKLLTYLFSKSYMIKYDAPLSVKKGFVKSELKDILIKCGFINFEIKRKWAFRWLIIIYL